METSHSQAECTTLLRWSPLFGDRGFKSLRLRSTDRLRVSRTVVVGRSPDWMSALPNPSALIAWMNHGRVVPMIDARYRESQELRRGLLDALAHPEPDDEARHLARTLVYLDALDGAVRQREAEVSGRGGQ
jgi:hypothetical protein